MMKNFWKAALTACLLAAGTAARAADPPVSTFEGAVVWANPPAAASASADTVTIAPDLNVLPPASALSDWGFVPKDPALDTISAEGNGVHIQVGKSDGTDWHYQVGRNKIVLVEGKTYVLTFRAKADAARTISVHAQAVGGDYHGVGLDAPLPLDTAWKASKITFVAKNVTDDTQLVYNVGALNGSVWLADVVLAQQADTAAAPAPVSALKVNVTAKGNGPFDVQTISKAFALTNGRSYTLSFQAKSDAPRRALVTVRIKDADYHAVSDVDTRLSLDTGWHTYRRTFTPTTANADSNVVVFSLGDQTGATWIADLKLVASGTGTAADAADPAPGLKSELPATPTQTAAIPKNAYRILFVGNSITQHQFNAGTMADLHWDHLSGMAASSQSTDYVHLLVGKIQTLMPRRPIATRITSLTPGGLGTAQERLAPVVADSAGFNPNLVVIQHGEHEQGTRGADALAGTYNALLDLFTTGTAHPKVVCIGLWSLGVNAAGTDYTDWAGVVQHTMQGICARRGIPFVSVAAIAADPACHGFGQHPGVQWHPDDKAHAEYADAIFAAVRPLLARSENSQPQPALHASRGINP